MGVSKECKSSSVPERPPLFPPLGPNECSLQQTRTPCNEKEASFLLQQAFVSNSVDLAFVMSWRPCDIKRGDNKPPPPRFGRGDDKHVLLPRLPAATYLLRKAARAAVLRSTQSGAEAASTASGFTAHGRVGQVPSSVHDAPHPLQDAPEPPGGAERTRPPHFSHQQVHGPARWAAALFHIRT